MPGPPTLANDSTTTSAKESMYNSHVQTTGAQVMQCLGGISEQALQTALTPEQKVMLEESISVINNLDIEDAEKAARAAQAGQMVVQAMIPLQKEAYIAEHKVLADKAVAAGILPAAIVPVFMQNVTTQVNAKPDAAEEGAQK
mmetsp:Transcript_67422/g.185933  ORF Transcript_67422/g.185933 Transcript_67422/m.185933 type:complete len:143 (-) Transcript_67422:2089-2517(-)